ncbi:UNVERIFIED_CONTAM: hypothetical protein PYX00_004721 [Menopon gallinae]|uniref:Sushi, von Willebrand factor type A, EGF and pentraxin domain-containing protein 1 n=1 Tax=Menopon gallinae TaxID=328185 RepID=A0AAW2I510_9NEOP
MAAAQSILVTIIFIVIVNGFIVEGFKLEEKPTESRENTTNEDVEYIEGEDGDDDSVIFDDEGKIYKNPRNSPTPLCPRDEEQAALLGQKCLRKCSTDEDCKSKKKKCFCDGHCGMSCIKPDRECNDLTSPELGVVTLSGRMFGDKASYTCDHGFHLVGLKERVCQADGSWSGRAPSCKQNIYCTSPPVIAHARHNAQLEQTTFDLDMSLTYQCFNGYVTNGFPKAKCLSIDGKASWFGPDISCEPRSCGAPMDISHGWHAGECYTLGCRVEYHCAEGYELVGRAERYCQADGTWSPRELPSCVLVTAVECPPPESPANGKAIYTSTSYNSVVSYECKYGFTLSGLQTRRCGADKKWTGLPPQCQAPCVVPRIQYGKRVILESTNETVSEFPLVVAHDEQLSIDCEDNYEMAISDTPVQCNNGTWSYIPACVPARCKTLPKPPRNGLVIAPKTEHGMKARYKCKDGYTLRGPNLTECSFGNWTGEPPHCQQVYCPFPGYIENGKVMLVGNMGLYDYRHYVKKVTNNKQIMYDCDKGYALSEGPPGATCVDGHWRPKQLPRCEPGLHPRLRWQRSVASEKEIILKNEEFFNSILKKTERNQYRVKKEIKKLRRKMLPRNYGKFKIRDKREVSSEEGNETLTYQKQKRALLMGHQTQQRQQQMFGRKKDDSRSDSKKKDRYGGRGGKEYDNGDDNETERGGVGGGSVLNKVKSGRGKVPCEPLSNEPFFLVSVIKYGKDPNMTNSAGTVIQVTCGPGYGLNLENNTAKCIRGSWKPAVPECTLLPCLLPESENGIFLLSDTQELLNSSVEIDNGQVVEFSCKDGYTIQGPTNLRCWHGQWAINTFPECNPMPCELPPIPHGTYLLGYRAGLTIGNGSSVQFTCDEHFTKTSKENIECVLGELLPGPPSCKNLGEATWFRGGFDITSTGGLTPLEGRKRPCAPPARVQGSLIYKDGEPMQENDKSFPDGTEVTFNCVATIMGDRTTWRIVCEDGSWVGRSMACDYDHLALTHERNNSCFFRNSEPNVVSFFNDQQITMDLVDFPSGSVLVSRCSDIGKYAFSGANVRKCVNGKWNASKPVCFGLNQENDYALEKPPTILFRHQLGPIAQSNEGKLIVYPGTVLHMECLWIRRFGTPKWQVSHEYRKYPEGWSTDPGRDSQLEYRLSIIHASKDDSGLFTCVTPTRHTHSIDVVVSAVHCPALPTRRDLIMSTVSTKMNTRVVFSCSNGNALIGSQELVCLPSGNWSAPVPLCQSIECADFNNLTDPNLKVSVLSREVGGRAVFSCSPGYGLQGVAESVCLMTGDWSLPLPTCQEVHCPSPGAPENGYIQGTGPYKAGDVVQFNCNPDFMMKGQPIIACQESGRWSGQLPKCVQACSYPGTTIKGRMSAVKFYYQIGENITFTCDEGLELQGPTMLKCMKTGKWSSAIPTCAYPNSTTPE